MKKKYIIPVFHVETINTQLYLLASSSEGANGWNTQGEGAGGSGGGSGTPPSGGGVGAPTLMDWSVEETEDL